MLQNCETLTAGIVSFPYAVLLDAFVPYLSDFKPKVASYVYSYIQDKLTSQLIFNSFIP